jgi:hypothetical protein
VYFRFFGYLYSLKKKEQYTTDQVSQVLQFRRYCPTYVVVLIP